MSGPIGEIRHVEASQLLALAAELRRAGVSSDARVTLKWTEQAWLFAQVDDAERDRVTSLAVDDAAEIHRGVVDLPARITAPRI